VLGAGFGMKPWIAEVMFEFSFGIELIEDIINNDDFVP
jgi:hypothetical protein